MENTKQNRSLEFQSQVERFFEDQLKDIFWFEKALTQTLPRMASKASSPDLIEFITKHVTETEGHVARCEKLFAMLAKEARGKKCEAMAGLFEDAKTVIGLAEEGPMRDAAIISAIQKVKHYEIAAYGTLRIFAQTMGLDEAVEILERTLGEEKNADALLSGLALSTINITAVEEHTK